MRVKSGYKTSEFWFTLVSFIFSGLYLTGILTENEHKEQLIEVVSHAVESCILISGQLIILYKYINSRSQIKKAEVGINNDTNRDDNKKNDNTRNRKSDTTRNRKTNTNSKRKITGSKKNSGR